MSHTHDHTAGASGYGGGGRTWRPLVALVPIGVVLVLCFAMLAEGVHVLSAPGDTAAGESHVAQSAVPSPAPSKTS